MSRWRKARRQYLTMSSTRWGWSAADASDNIGEGENSSGIPDGLVCEDSRDGSQSAAKDDPKVKINNFIFSLSLM